LFAIVPLAVVDASTASSDLAMTFYLVAAATSIAVCIKEPRVVTAGLAGAMCSISLAFKIAAGIYLLPLGLVAAAAVIFRRGEGIHRLRQGTVFLLGGLVLGAPWLLLRFGETGNPVFPFFNN